MCTRKPRDQTPPVVAAGAPSAAVGGHRGHRRRRKRLLLLFKKAAGQQNAAAASAAGPQINSRPVITRAPFSPPPQRRAGPGRPCKNIMIKTTAAADDVFRNNNNIMHARTRHIMDRCPRRPQHSSHIILLFITHARSRW